MKRIFLIIDKTAFTKRKKAQHVCARISYTVFKKLVVHNRYRKEHL